MDKLFYSQVTNVVSLVVSFVGFSILVHRIGVRYTLLIFPVVMFFAVVITNLVPSLWALFVMVSILKALVYSLNDPVVELLYMPTSEPIKFKAKAWIDVVGARSAKALGSVITSLSSGDVQKLRRLSEIPMILIAVLFLIVVWITGKEFDQLIQQNIVIGKELEENSSHYNNNNNNNNNNNDGNNNTNRRRINGLLPGDVGYSGYDPDEVFEGVDFDIYKRYEKNNDQSKENESIVEKHLRKHHIEPFHMEDFSAPGSNKNQSVSIWR